VKNRQCDCFAKTLAMTRKNLIQAYCIIRWKSILFNRSPNHPFHEHQHQPHPQSILLLRRRFPCHQIRRAHLIHTLNRLQRLDRRAFPQYHPSCDPRLAGMATAAEIAGEERIAQNSKSPTISNNTGQTITWI